MGEELVMSRRQAKEFLDAFLNCVREVLRSGEKITINGFGTFDTKVRSEHTGVNPVTGEKIVICENLVPYFKPSKGLKEYVRD